MDSQRSQSNNSDPNELERVHVVYPDGTVENLSPSESPGIDSNGDQGQRIVVAAFDPGEHTGFVLGLCTTAEGGRLSLPQISGRMTFAYDERFDVLESLFYEYRMDVVIVEDFRLYPHRAKWKIGSAFPEVRLIGAIETFVHLQGEVGQLVYQPAANAKGLVIPDDIIAALHSEHEKDAYRHIRYYVLSHNNKLRQKQGNQPPEAAPEIQSQPTGRSFLATRMVKP